MIDEQKIDLFERMPIPSAVARLAIPTILSSLVMVLYNLADTYFVGMLQNPVQNAGVTLAAPVLLAFNAVNNLFGVGSFAYRLFLSLSIVLIVYFQFAKPVALALVCLSCYTMLWLPFYREYQYLAGFRRKMDVRKAATAAGRGEVSLEEAVEAIKRESRRYAKRQITWFKREEQVEFLPIDAFPSRQALLEEAVSLLGKWGVWKGGNACEQ